MRRTTSSAPTRPRVAEALAALRDRGDRVTRVRHAVIEVLDATTEHLTADEIASRAEGRAPGLHRASVYRALAVLGERGLVTHTHLGGAATVYHLSVERRDGPAETAGHAHLQCTRCSRVIDIPVTRLESLVDSVERELGFRLEPRHTALLGVCADCR